MDSRPLPRHRVGRALAATAATAATAWALAGQAVRAADGGPAPDALVGVVVLGVGAVAAAVLATGCAMVVATGTARAFGRTWTRTERLAAHLLPRALRRTLAVGVGAGLTLGLGTGAVADEVDVDWQVTTGAVPAVVLDDAEAPEEAAPRPGAPDGETDAPPTEAPSETAPETIDAPAAPATPDPTAPPAPPAPPAAPPATVTVAPGDSLWAITARLLPDGASDAEVAAAWPGLYEANRDVVGPDPDLIHPGVVLTVPDGGLS